MVAAAGALLVWEPRSLPLAAEVGLALARIFCAVRGTRIESGPLKSPFVVTVY